MRKPYLLSVCMIVKDEENNLVRCLDSIKPVLEQVSSELIVVDTGSVDRTVEIARQYTEKVYYHEWNNNFSDMRNISISYAQGEWIFIFDADEELDDPEGLLKLLRFEKLENFNTVRFQAKNILSYANPKDIFHITERLFRNDGEFCYVGSVHNQPRFKHPILNTDILINHYGYNNDDLELMEKKFKRTSTLLLKELEKDPENIYFMFQLARSYLMHKDLKEALEYIEQTYALVKKVEDVSILSRYYYVFGEYVRILYYNEKFEKALELSEETLELAPQYVDMQYYKAVSYYRLEKKDEALEAFIHYLELIDLYRANKLDMTQFAAIEMHSIDPRVVTAAASQVIQYYYDKEQYEDALKYVNYMDERRETGNAIIRILLKLGRYLPIGNYYRRIKNRELATFFVATLENEIRTLDVEQVKKVSAAFVQGDDAYADFCAIRASSEKVPHIRRFLEKYEFHELPEYPYALVMAYAIEEGISLTSLWKKMTDSAIKRWVKTAIDGSEAARAELKRFVTHARPRSNDLHANRLLTALGNVLLLTAVEEAKRDKTSVPIEEDECIDSYLLAGMQYVAGLYQAASFRIMWKTLDNIEHQFYILMYLAKDAADRGQMKAALDYYKEAGDCYPYFAEIVKRIVSRMQAESNRNLLLQAIVKDTRGQEGMKVLHGTIEIANQMALLVGGLRSQGVNAKGLTYYPNYLKYHADYVYDVNASPSTKVAMRHVGDICRQAVESFDVFHFHFGTTLMPDHSDLPLLKERGKSMLMHYWGSEVRMLSIARKWNPYVAVKFPDEDAIKRKLDLMASWIDHCVVADHELYQYVRGYHKHTHFIKQTIDTEVYKPLESFTFRKKKPVVVHAPTSPEIKGTKFVLEAVESLKRDFDFEFVLVQNKSHEEARKIYQQADLVLDELLCGSYGILALEAMAMEKPLVTYINEHVREYYPASLPIVSANPDTLKDVLVPLLKDWELRQELGRKGREYVLEHHDANRIANQFIDLYEAIRP